MLLSQAPARLPLYALLSANALSWHGSAITALAVPWFVLHTTNSPALTGVVALCGLSGGLLSYLLGPGLVDRLGYRATSVLADALSALVIATIPLLHGAGLLTPLWLAALAFLRALLDGPGQTARASLLPDLAGRGHLSLERANTLNEVADSGASWTGPLLAGALIAALGAGTVLWFDAASFVLSALLIGLLVPGRRSIGEAGRPATQPGRAGRWSGWRFLWAEPALRVIFGWSVVFGALMAALFAVALPVFARTVGGALGLGVLVSSFGGGAVMGALLFGRFGHRWPRRTTFLVSVSGLCGLFAALAASPGVPLAALAFGVCGLIAGPNGPLIPTVLQERTPPELRARVVAASEALTLAAAPVGVLLCGLALEHAPLRAVLWGMTALFALGVLAAALDPGWRASDARGAKRRSETS